MVGESIIPRSAVHPCDILDSLQKTEPMARAAFRLLSALSRVCARASARAGVPVFALALSLGCSRAATTEECYAMTEHYVDLSLVTERGAGQGSERRADSSDAPTLEGEAATAVRAIKREVKRAEPAYRKAYEHCADITSKEYRCAIDAKTPEAWNACIKL